jgi:dTDP-glucose 4,6-dehydratase
MLISDVDENRGGIVATALVTGGAGFIGANLVRFLRKERPDWTVVNVDKLTYAGNLSNLAGVEVGDNYVFIHGDIAEPSVLERLWSRTEIDFVFHLAAETHVDRSLKDVRPFLRTNIEGTSALIDICRAAGVKKFVYVSTDEVYGPTPRDSGVKLGEDAPFRPGNPYSATKAAADLLCQAASNSFEFPVVIARPTNNYGSYQHPEKFLPLMATNLLTGGQVPVYGKGEQMRDWLYVEDTCRALLLLAEQGEVGKAYNIAGTGLIPNLEFAREVLRILRLDEDCLTFVPDRPGHDFAYSIDDTRIRSELGFAERTGLEDGLLRTVYWYKENETWWRAVREGRFKEYYEQQYPGL